MDNSEPTPDFPLNPEVMLATLARLFAHQGAPREVAILAFATPVVHFAGMDSWATGEAYYYRLELQIPVSLFVQVFAEREDVEQRILEHADPLLAAHPDYSLRRVVITSSQQVEDGWRPRMFDWLRGSGVTNQGRVRSDNWASRDYDGLLFRSQPEIYLYRALKALGVSFAPLPVFVRGGKEYRRIEPDFVILRQGLVVVVEVDGATVHVETPAEAHNRTTILEYEGARILRVDANRCATPELATGYARELLQIITSLKASQ